MFRLSLLLLLLLVGPAPQRGRKPNIVLFYADDAGYVDLGFQPGAAPDIIGLTPRIDSIAEGGVTFTDAYASACACSPARAGLLTGRYQTRFGHENNLPEGYLEGGLAAEETTLPERLGLQDYATGLVGKWHLGYTPAQHPNARGFEWFYGLVGSARGYFAEEELSPYLVIQENGEPTEETGYLTDRFGDAAVRFIRRNRSRPFFLMVSFTAPHGPVQAKESDLPARDSVDDWPRRRYAGVVKCMDENVGKVLDVLDEYELAKNTLVVFTNDNGSDPDSGARNGPLKGWKGSLSEGGIRVPLTMRWPARIPSGGTVTDPVIALDLLPTFLAAAGIEVKKRWKLDGIDLLPRLTEQVAGLAPRPLFWRTGGARGEIAVRVGSHKLHFPDRAQGTTPLLHDLSVDAGEEHDLAQDETARVARLRTRLEAWEKQQVAPLWNWKASVAKAPEGH